ncbi:MAG: hypothetical protein C0402_11460 [Thermodesulfovibrio sp.]|nr:hypothetical protein [Thermodesulfovibrio sp.]
MRVPLAADREEITVCTMNPVYRGGPVFYASFPCGPSVAENLKHCLASTLWDHLMAMETPLWKCSQFSNGAALPIQVVRGLLGRPRFLLGEYEGPSISFSEGGGNLWAALCGDKSAIGIDVAGSNEFKKEYPFHRVFHPEELQQALRITGENLEEAAALLWSVKEAAVKALGSAFHLVDPLQIIVYPYKEEAGEKADGDAGYSFSVGLSGKARKRLESFSLAAGALSVRSLPQRKAWLSIALLREIRQAMNNHE